MSTDAASVRFNFSAGPAQLPDEVHAETAEAIRFHPPSGRPLLELGHRSDAFAEIMSAAEADLRSLLGIPDSFAVLFGNGGARLHYALWLPNLAETTDAIGYVDTGYWSRMAIDEAVCQRREPRILTAPVPTDYPDLSPADSAGLAFVHYVSNETITGLSMPTPQVSCPLVCDRTSDFLSEPFDLSPYAMVYAGSQKNFGTAGLSVLVVRRDCIKEAQVLPRGFRYSVQIEARGLWHTPAVLPWFVASRMLRWIRAQGGLPEMQRRAHARARALYEYIDSSDFYRNDIHARARSRMNVCFFLPDAAREERFLVQAATAGLAGLRGHPVQGGIRASLYNAMPDAGADALLQFLRDFEATA